MNTKESELLDDLQAWRKAAVATMDGSHHVKIKAMFGGDPSPLLRVENGRFSRAEAEPEMVEALAKVREALAGLEPAREKIVARKLWELRVMGIHSGEVTQ